MVDSISSMSGSMAMVQQGGGTRRPPPPPQGEDVFQLTDSDGNGSVSQTELTTLVEGIEEVTGNTIDVEKALSSFDADQDGGLSGEELLTMMQGYGFTPPEMESGEESSSSMMPPPPPSSDQVLTAYGQNSGDDQISQLLDLLQTKDEETEYSSVDVSS